MLLSRAVLLALGLTVAVGLLSLSYTLGLTAAVAR
jgi:hypothetical protein